MPNIKQSVNISSNAVRQTAGQTADRVVETGTKSETVKAARFEISDIYDLWGKGQLTQDILLSLQAYVEQRGDTPWSPYIQEQILQLMNGNSIDWSSFTAAFHADSVLGAVSLSTPQTTTQVEDGRKSILSDASKASQVEIKQADIITYMQFEKPNNSKDYDVYIGVVSVSPRATGDSTVDVSPHFRVDSRVPLPPAHNILIDSIIRIERDGDVIWSHPRYRELLRGAATYEKA